MTTIRCLILLLILLCPVTNVRAAEADAVEITSPPESFFELVRSRHRDDARQFYAKYTLAAGMPVVAAAEVADEALMRTSEIVAHMLAGRPDIVQAMIDRGMYLVVIGKGQLYTDIPEYSSARNKDYLNERVRGTGGLPTSFGEENLLSLPIDRYDDESIGVHEFCHTIDGALRSIDLDWRDRRNAVYEHAIAKGLYKGAYAGSNPGEYWAEVGQAYFDCNRVNNWNHIHVANREQLKTYDPEGYELCRSVFNLKPGQDWHYTWLQKLPNVDAPPAKFKIDPYYTKFTWAREFTVIGREASDEALLKANDTVRKMFAYRHDILKALMAEDLKLVVLGPNESLSDLPEFSNAGGDGSIDLLARTLEYHPDRKLLVVGEENVMGDPAASGVGENQVIRVFAKAFFEVTGKRPVDPNWENRGRDVQQYELHVKRLDVEFGNKVEALFAKAQEAGTWKGTSAVHDAASYWAVGVLAYFDAQGQDGAPNDAPHPIRTREQLAEYDPPLYELVNETMAYDGRVDWRFCPADK